MHEDSGTWWEQYFNLLQNPAHWLFEITIQIVIDLLIIYFGYRIIVQKHIVPRLRKEIHDEIDRDHDLVHEHINEKDMPVILMMSGATFDRDSKVTLPSGKQVNGEEMMALIASLERNQP